MYLRNLQYDKFYENFDWRLNVQNMTQSVCAHGKFTIWHAMEWIPLRHLYEA
jgi:hypothetical protein